MVLKHAESAGAASAEPDHAVLADDRHRPDCPDPWDSIHALRGLMTLKSLEDREGGEGSRMHLDQLQLSPGPRCGVARVHEPHRHQVSGPTAPRGENPRSEAQSAPANVTHVPFRQNSTWEALPSNASSIASCSSRTSRSTRVESRSSGYS